ncbi:MAG: 30S ribosomal protein S9 [Puniceicoccales bacterium]|jgi:small subunit ribosomal protein S9|nr:30S ribosomal protein S9 [Puniceicoccales bacterium]
MTKSNKIQFRGTGRRKCAVACVTLEEGTGKIDINGRGLSEFCSLEGAEKNILAPLMAADMAGKVDISVRAYGGGISGQLDAISLAIARSLEKMNPELRPALKKDGLLSRDSRIKERKKPGQPGARKRYQFSKR